MLLIYGLNNLKISYDSSRPLEDKYYQPEAEQYYNETYKK